MKPRRLGRAGVKVSLLVLGIQSFARKIYDSETLWYRRLAGGYFIGFCANHLLFVLAITDSHAQYNRRNKKGGYGGIT